MWYTSQTLLTEYTYITITGIPYSLYREDPQEASLINNNNWRQQTRVSRNDKTSHNPCDSQGVLSSCFISRKRVIVSLCTPSTPWPELRLFSWKSFLQIILSLILIKELPSTVTNFKMLQTDWLTWQEHPHGGSWLAGWCTWPNPNALKLVKLSACVLV